MAANSEIPKPVLWTIVGAVALAAGLAGVVGPRGASHREAELRAWADAARIRFEQRDFHRTATWGDTRPGSAFESYDEALDLAGTLGATDGESIEASLRDPKALEPDKAEALRTRWSEAIEAMRTGAHRGDARPAADWSGTTPTTGTEHDPLNGRWLVEVAMIDARELHAADRRREAVELMLDAATFGADLTGSASLADRIVGATLLSTATDEAWPDMGLIPLDVDSLKLLGAGLASLDQRLQDPWSADTDLLLTASSILAGSGGTSPHGLMAAPAECTDAFFTVAGALDDLHLDAQRPWPALEKAITAAHERIRTDTDPVARSLWPPIAQAELTRRQTLTRLRLLRIAVDLHQGLRSPEMADPLGDGTLKVLEAGLGWVVSSAGMSGEHKILRIVGRRDMQGIAPKLPDKIDPPSPR